MKHQTQIIALPDRQEIFVTRVFDAPQQLVFKAFTEPALYSQWMGCKHMTMEIDQYNCVDGGYYRHIDTLPNGSKAGTHGVFHEVLVPFRIIQTFEYEGLPERGHVILRTITVEEVSSNQAKLVIHSVFISVADRDGMLASGMERGVNESHERLDALLTKELTNIIQEP